MHLRSGSRSELPIKEFSALENPYLIEGYSNNRGIYDSARNREGTLIAVLHGKSMNQPEP